VARGQGASGQKASAHWISEFGFRILSFSFSIRIPQSAFRILVARLVHEMEAASWFLRRWSLPPGLASEKKLLYFWNEKCI
jgi:hypothetical protein